MTIQELINKRAVAWQAAKDFAENHRNENGLMEAADMETYDKMEKDITDYTKEIERMQRQEAMDRELEKATSTPIVEKPKVMEDEEPKSFRARKEYKDAMGGIYTSCVNKGTLDESPMAYKPIDEIIANIEPPAEIISHIRPIYNFKAGDED